MLIAISTFLAIAGIVIAAYWLLLVRPEQQAQDSLRKRLDSIQPQTAQRQALVTDLRFSHLELLNRLLSHNESLTRGLQNLIDQSGLSTTVGTVGMASACLAVSGFGFLRLLTHVFASQIGAAAIGSLIPIV